MCKELINHTQRIRDLPHSPMATHWNTEIFARMQLGVRGVSKGWKSWRLVGCDVQITGNCQMTMPHDWRKYWNIGKHAKSERMAKKQQLRKCKQAVHPPPAMTDCLEVKAPAHTSWFHHDSSDVHHTKPLPNHVSRTCRWNVTGFAPTACAITEVMNVLSSIGDVE